MGWGGKAAPVAHARRACVSGRHARGARCRWHKPPRGASRRAAALATGCMQLHPAAAGVAANAALEVTAPRVMPAESRPLTEGEAPGHGSQRSHGGGVACTPAAPDPRGLQPHPSHSQRSAPCLLGEMPERGTCGAAAAGPNRPARRLPRMMRSAQAGPLAIQAPRSPHTDLAARAVSGCLLLLALLLASLLFASFPLFSGLAPWAHVALCAPASPPLPACQPA